MSDYEVGIVNIDIKVKINKKILWFVDLYSIVNW